MSETTTYDIAIIGGGIMGCATALRVAEGGMSAIVLDQGDLGQGASGVNAGTLSLQIKRVKLMPYALKGHHLWEQMGEAVGFAKTGGYTLAFNAREAQMLQERQTLKAQAGAPISFVSNVQLSAAEPNLTQKVEAASFCPEDGYANSSLTGQYYRGRLRDAHIPYREGCKVTAIERTTGFALTTPDGTIHAKRILLAAGRMAQTPRCAIGCGSARKCAGEYRVGDRTHGPPDGQRDWPCDGPVDHEAKGQRHRVDWRRLAGFGHAPKRARYGGRANRAAQFGAGEIRGSRIGAGPRDAQLDGL